MIALTMSDILQWINVLLIPILIYIVKIEMRIVRIETMQGAQYQNLVRRTRHHDMAEHELE